MADIAPIAASSATTQTSANGANLIAVQIAVADVSKALQTLSSAIQTNATPVAPPVGNNLTLTTALGQVTVTLPQLSAAEQQVLIQQLTSLALTQKPLTLALQPGSPPTTGALLVPTPVTAVAQPPAAQAASTTNVAIPLAPLATGETFPAIVLPPALSVPLMAPMPFPALTPSAIPQQVPPQPSPQSALPQMPMTVPSPIAPISVPLAAPEQTMVPPQPAPTPMAPAASAPTVLPTPTLATLLQPGHEVTLTVNSVIPPSTSSAPLPALAPNQITATVTGAGTDSQLILKAGDATLFVKAQVTAPVGTTVILTVEPTKAPLLITAPSANATNFPALPQALAALAQSDPQTLQQIMTARVPQPTEALPGALMMLFSAFRQGNVKGWIGEAATESLIHSGKAELIKSLAHDLTSAGQPAHDGVVGEWKSYPIPLYSQAQFQALTLYVHNDKNSQQDRAVASSAQKIRFLIDMRLSRLGAMQIDGFVQSKKLDMILRSESLLPEGLHHELRGAYIKAMGAVGFTGSLNFQVGRQNWMVMQRAASGMVT